MAGQSAHDEVHAPVEDTDVPVGLKVLVLTMVVLMMLLLILLVAVLAEIDLFQAVGGAALLLAAPG